MAPKKPQKWTAEADELRATIRDMAKKIDTVNSLERRIEALESQCQEESKRVSTYFDMVVRMGQITAQSVRGAIKWGERTSTLQAEVRKLEEREKQGKRTRRELEGRVEDAEERYQRAERQLDASEHFRSTADEYSGAEIAAAVERLNDVIFQVACTLADRALEETGSLPQSVEAAAHSQKQLRLSTKEVKKEWEGYIVQQMASEAEGKNPAFLKSMIQSLVARWCHQIIKEWCRQNPDTEETMKAIWDGVKDKCESCSSFERASWYMTEILSVVPFRRPWHRKELARDPAFATRPGRGRRIAGATGYLALDAGSWVERKPRHAEGHHEG